MHTFNHNKILDWMGLALCLLIPILGLLWLQPLPGSALTDVALSYGQWWTLWSGHVLHYTLDHFIWDALMFAVFVFLLWPEERWRIWLWLGCAAPIISVFVFSVEPMLQEYRGLSALDTMLCVRFFTGFFSSDSRRERWLFGGIPLCGLALKISYEWVIGHALFVADLGDGVVPLASAHFAGLMIGALWGYVVARRVHSRQVGYDAMTRVQD